jgi:RNA polymerase sigma-70 factor, ECF subfamily
VKKPGSEEQQAVARLKRCDLGGLEWLVRSYQVRAVYASFLIVRDLKCAEDIVQDAFLRAAEKIEQFDDRRPFGGWFLRSVVNASIKAAERQKRFIPLDGKDADDESTPLGEWLLDPDPCPERLVETEETRQQVWEALAALTAEQRAAIVMRHFLEMSEAEMTRELDRPLTTVRWRLKAAHKQLRKFLQPFWKADLSEVEDEEDV